MASRTQIFQSGRTRSLGSCVNAIGSKHWNFYGRLTPYPTHPDWGYNIAATVPFDQSHRHFSHLFMVWPLMLQNLSDPTFAHSDVL